jgi:hypothetical protein
MVQPHGHALMLAMDCTGGNATIYGVCARTFDTTPRTPVQFLVVAKREKAFGTKS